MKAVATRTTGSLETITRFYDLALLGMLGSGYGALVMAGALHPLPAALAGLCLLARLAAALVWPKLYLPSRWATVAAICYLGLYPLDWWTSGDFLSATVHLVIFLAGIKLITPSSQRDYTLLQLIAVLQMMSATLQPAGLSFLVFLCAFLSCAMAAYSSGEIRRSLLRVPAQASSPDSGLSQALPSRLAALTLVAFCGVAVLSLALFFLLPRTARAALRQFVPASYHLPGFSNEVTLGEIGTIQQSSTTVLRVKFAAEQPPQNLRWRGAALTNFDGRRWTYPSQTQYVLPVESGMVRLANVRQRSREGSRFSYLVQVKATDTDALFIAGLPEFLRIDAATVTRNDAGALRLVMPHVFDFTYVVHSFLQDDEAAPDPSLDLSSEEQAINLQLPPLDPRIQALAAERAGGGTPVEQAQRLEQYLHTQFRYSLQLPDKESADPLAHFLFERREGHCEYFASALVVMLRSLGIPSRVVTGFLGGVYNPLSGWQVIRSSDAHSWVEAAMPGRGWVTFDPTPPNPNALRTGLRQQLAMYLDAFETLWQQWFVGYDLNQQLLLAARADQSIRQWRTQPFEWRLQRLLSGGTFSWQAVPWVTLGGAVLLAVSALWLLPLASNTFRRHRQRRRVLQGRASETEATLLYERALHVLRRHNIDRGLSQTPSEVQRGVSDPVLSATLARVTIAFEALRYGGRTQAMAPLLQAVEELERLPGRVVQP